MITGLGMSAQAWMLAYLVNSLWQVPLLSVSGWLASRAARQIGPHAEHPVWVSVLLLQSILPAICLLPWNLPGWQWLHALALWGHVASEGKGAVSVVLGKATALADGQVPVRKVALFLYCVATLYAAARFAWRAFMLNVIRREAVAVQLTGQAASCWERCRHQLGVQDALFAFSTRITAPVTMGRRHKLLLVPAEMMPDLCGNDLEAVFAHEFAHMQRNDFQKNLLYECAALPVAYHPLLWLTRERLVESREMVCDQIAAGLNGRHEYARSLLRLASRLMNATPVRTRHAIGIFDTNTFERRLMKLTDVNHNARGLKRSVLVAACVVLGVFTCGSALVLRVDASTTTNEGPSAASKKISVASGVMAGQRLSGDDPKYPQAAKEAKIQGKVVLDAVISTEGDVEDLTVVSGPKELQAASLDAVRTWKYKPYVLNGDPVAVETTINIIYSLGA